MPSNGIAYADASALVKLVVDERETAGLRAALRDREAVVSSELALTEVGRAVRRVAAERPRDDAVLLTRTAEELLAGVDLVPLDRAVLEAAGELAGAQLRSLDAIHVVAALSLGAAVSAFVTYDARQAEAAAAHGLAVEAPGRT